MNKIDWIKQQNADNFGTLNTPVLIPNPTPQQQVPAPFPNIATISNLIPPLERFAIQETKAYERLLEAIEIGNSTWIMHQIENLSAAGKISNETLGNLIPLMSQTIADPNWQEYIYITPAELAGFDTVTLQEWQEAINT